MNKMTKISAAALLALLVAACDKPANTTAAVSNAETAQLSPEAVQAQGVADYAKIVEWNAQQEQAMAGFQNALQEKLSSGDKGQIEAALTEFTAKVTDVLKGLDAIEIKNEEVNAFKAKMKETLTLSNDLIAESVKVMANPTTEAQQMIQGKTQQLLQAGGDLQKLQAELQTKFGAK